GQVIHGRSVPDRLDDAERYADREDEESGDDAVIDRHRKAVGDHFDHGLVVTEGLPQIELYGLQKPSAVSDRKRLVEAVEFAQLLQLLVGDVELDAVGRTAAPASGLAAAARTRELETKLVDRPAGHELAEREREEGDADEGWNHEQKPAHNIIAQCFAA